MTSTNPPAADRELARRVQSRRALFFVSGIVPLFVVADLLVAPEVAPWTFAIRLAWSGFLIGLGWRAHLRSRRGFTWTVSVAAAGSTLFYLAISAVSGGTASPLFAWNLAVPLAVAIVAQHERSAVVAGVATSWVATVVLMLAWGEPLRVIAMWSVLLLASACIAVYAGVSYHRLRVAEDASEHARVAASRQLAESEARRAGAERLALLGRLSAGVAHEINNPLNVLTLSVDLIDRAPEILNDPQKREQRVRALKEATSRIAAIVEDLRTWAREADDSPSQTCSVHEAVDVAVRLSQLRLRAVSTVTRELPPRLPLVAIGSRQLSQVLVNLLVNAGDALDEHRRRDPWICVSARPHPDGVELLVEDNGPGIPESLRDRVFREVVTTKPPDRGTGLGLNISRDYVERAGGTIHYEDRPEGGARFVIRLPIAR